MTRILDRFASFHVTSIYTSMFTIDPRHVVYGTCAYFRDARVRRTHPSESYAALALSAMRLTRVGTP